MNRFALGIEGDHAIALGVGHVVGEHRCTVLAGIGGFELFDQVVAVKNIVPQHQGAGMVVHKVAANDEGLGQAIG